MTSYPDAMIALGQWSALRPEVLAGNEGQE
jgi:hypothetical protein